MNTIAASGRRWSAIGRAAPGMVRRRIAHRFRSGKVEVLVAWFVAHLGFGISRGDEPRSDARRYFANTPALELVDTDAVELVLFRSEFDSNPQLPTRVTRKYTRSY